jgi:formylglycine-generating enzyme required for sulfatase activity
MSKAQIFISYSHNDEEEKELLVKHLGVLAGVEVWVDDRIGAGQHWQEEIDRAMSSASVAIFLVTVNFLNSKFIVGTEVPELLSRKREGVRVIPIIGKPCAWQRVDWLSEMNVRPKNGDPVWREGGKHADAELAKIADEVASILETLETPPGARREVRGASEPETVLIPEGSFVMGSPEGDDVFPCETPQHEVILRDYRIGKYPVTHEQYAQFVKHAHHPAPDRVGWLGITPPKSRLDHPVVGVSWFDARKFCEWLRERTDRRYRLPTEAEWEKAARGEEGQVYTWGDEWVAGCCNCRNNNTTAVTDFPDGASPYGCCDMIGNVAEWTSTIWGPSWKRSDFLYPYDPDDGRQQEDDPTAYRLVRGGALNSKESRLHCAARQWFPPDSRDNTLGFRVVLDV